MPFWGAPLSARHITGCQLRDLGRTLVTLLTVPTLLRNEAILCSLSPSHGALESYRSGSPEKLFQAPQQVLIVSLGLKGVLTTQNTMVSMFFKIQLWEGPGICTTLHCCPGQFTFSLYSMFSKQYWIISSFFLLKFLCYVQDLTLFYMPGVGLGRIRIGNTVD